jgi:hypothetical protein
MTTMFNYPIMKTLPRLTAILLAVVFTGCATSPHCHAYEYRFYHADKLAGNVEKEINELAKEGWRVRSLALGDNGSTKYVVLERRIKE